ncbi:MAG: NUDIX hydrolase [Propionibacteriaceae bacterium]
MTDLPEEPTVFKISVRVEGDIGTLEWEGATTEEILAETISLAADDALLGHDLRRLDIAIPAPDLMARRAAQRAGFRLEGVRRHGLEVRPQEYVDVYLYGRLASDIVYGAEGFSAVMTSVLPKTRALAHVLFRRADGMFLFCATSYKAEWELPGGVVEAHEPPRVAAQREVAEELGIDLQPGKLLAVDWLPPALGWDDAVEFIFDGGTLTEQQQAQLHPSDSEITALHWVTAAEACDHLSPGAARRLRQLASPSSTTPLYLEDGIAL